jgi:hypothetical protein
MKNPMALEARAEIAMGRDPKEVVSIIEEARKVDPGRSGVLTFLGTAGDICFILCVVFFLAGLWILVSDLLRSLPSK